MPASSERQRRYLEARHGHDWVKRHHFDRVKKRGKRDRRGEVRALVKELRRA